MSYEKLGTKSFDYVMLKEACREAKKSPDPSTQNGTVLVAPGVSGFKFGVNRFPYGIKVTPERWERPAKYLYVEHAERAVIYLCARSGSSTYGGTLYALWAACHDCARAIIESGIRRVVCRSFEDIDDEASIRWRDSVAAGLGMLKEAGVQVVKVPGPIFPDGQLILLRNGFEYTP